MKNLPELKEIKKILIDKKISQVELSKITGLSRITLNKILNGKENPDVIKAIKIAKALDYPVEWLFKEWFTPE